MAQTKDFCINRLHALKYSPYASIIKRSGIIALTGGRHRNYAHQNLQLFSINLRDGLLHYGLQDLESSMGFVDMDFDPFGGQGDT